MTLLLNLKCPAIHRSSIKYRLVLIFINVTFIDSNHGINLLKLNKKLHKRYLIWSSFLQHFSKLLQKYIISTPLSHSLNLPYPTHPFMEGKSSAGIEGVRSNWKYNFKDGCRSRPTLPPRPQSAPRRSLKYYAPENHCLLSWQRSARYWGLADARSMLYSSRLLPKWSDAGSGFGWFSFSRNDGWMPAL